jgi:hypothetical protein
MCTSHATLPTRTATLQNGYARGLSRASPLAHHTQRRASLTRAPCLNPTHA